MTLKWVKEQFKPFGLTIRKTPFQDYCVRIKNSPCGMGYYTGMLDDAYHTGLAMYNEQHGLGGNARKQ